MRSITNRILEELTPKAEPLSRCVHLLRDFPGAICGKRREESAPVVVGNSRLGSLEAAKSMRVLLRGSAGASPSLATRPQPRNPCQAKTTQLPRGGSS